MESKLFSTKYSRMIKLILDILFYLAWIFALLGKVFYFQFTTKINLKPFDSTENINTLTSGLGLLLIVFSIILLVVYKHRKKVLWVIALLLSIILFGDTLYYRYYSTPLNVALLYQISYIGDVGGSISSLYKTKDIIYFIDLPFQILGIFIIGRFKSYELDAKLRYVIAIFIFILGFFTTKDIYSISNTTLYAYDRNYAAKDLSILYYHYYDVENFVKDTYTKLKPITLEEREKVEHFYKNNEQKGHVYQGIAQDSNVIIVQIEALQQFVIGKEIEGQAITPFLEQFIDANVYFDNIYHQVAGGNTSDAEFLTNVSLYPAKAGAVYFRYPQNRYDSLPSILKDKGYNTYAFHGYRPSFWNRLAMYQNLGFDKFFSMEDFDTTEKKGWAISDKELFRQGMSFIDTSRPFYNFMVTLSSHHPYDAFMHDDFKVGEYEGTQLGNYIKAAHYVDWAIEQLVNDLKERGLYDNTLLVLYGDHSALFRDQQKDLTEFLNIPYTDFEWKKIQKVPLMMHIPGLDSSISSHITGGEIDILPTLSNLLNIKTPYAMGKDLLNTETGYAVLRNSSVITDDIMFLSENRTVYDMVTGEKLPLETYKDDLLKYIEGLEASDIILEKNYLDSVDRNERN